MKNIVKIIIRLVGLRVFDLVLKKIDQQNELLRLAAKENLKTRAMLKKAQGLPINVLFVCHEPSLWGMFDSIYSAMAEDSGFNPTVVTLPYKHNSLPEGEFKDAGMAEFLEALGFSVVRGYDEESGKWMMPDELSPDYIFFQTPYGLFPPAWSAEQVSLIARVCYIPYATCLFKGEVESVLHPASFFQHVRLVFKEGEFLKDQFIKKFCRFDWFNERSVVVSGLPKLDGLFVGAGLSRNVWKKDSCQDVKRILWTPRWNTGEGSCHFFDYKDFFINFCREHQDVDFAFRPHPLCLQNFIKTGEMTEAEIVQMEAEYEQSENMVIDKTGDYRDTFLSCDILVSDISSMMLEYMVTGKPVIYTHRVNQFNDFGQELSKGIYWVRNKSELMETLGMLLAGNDPLWDAREQLMQNILFMPPGGAGGQIVEMIRSDFGCDNV